MKQRRSLPRKAVDLAKGIVVGSTCVVAGLGLIVLLYTSPLWARHPKNKP